MTQRTIPAAQREQIERTSSPDAILAFLTITHPNLTDPIRVVSDVFAYEKGGETYEGIVFNARILNDDESPPATEITLPNVDRRIGQALRGSRERAKLALELCSSADFDLSAEPRLEIGTAAPSYSFEYYELTDVDADAAEMRGRVFLRDFSQEPWPRVAATQPRLPGLYR